MEKPRLRDLGVHIGRFPPGPQNAITDVAGIRVGHSTLISDVPTVARTGVTVVVPRHGAIWQDHCFAGFHSFNGNGEMTGMHWMAESGLLVSPIALTSTHYVGIAHRALVEDGLSHGLGNAWALPVVAETFDGFLNDPSAASLTETHVREALARATSGVVAEGSVGGGTGMVCHGFKGGIGTASRIVPVGQDHYPLGVLVQANYGRREHLRVDGIPVGARLPHAEVPLPNWRPRPEAPASSIIVVLATDAPLLPIQCRRLAQRATVGLSRVGGMGFNGSGDLFLAFSTANHVPITAAETQVARWLPHAQLDPLFEAAAEATEEAILNALCAGHDMVGHNGNRVYGLPTDRLRDVLQAGGRQ